MIITDLSDEAMVLKYGHVINEIPELWDALRRFEIENRPATTPGGFAIKGNWVSVQRGPRDMMRVSIGSPLR